MPNPLRSFKISVLNSRYFSPKLYREYWFLKTNIRYLRRSIVGREEWRHILARPPVLAGFNTVGACDARCCYCAAPMNESDGIMDMKLFEKGIREFSAMGGGAIGLSPLTGEPLLDPLLLERLAFAERFENITDVRFDTNGIMLRKKQVRDGLLRFAPKLRIQMNISIPAFERDMFERVCNVAWDDSILHGIADLLAANRRLGQPLDINLYVQPDGPGALNGRNFRDYIRPHIDDNHIVLYGRLRDNWCGQITQDRLTGDMELRRHTGFRNIPCEFLIDGHVDVLVNGDVRMCGCRYGETGKHDELVIGSLVENDLNEIWFGDGPRTLCERFLGSDVPSPCRSCTLYLPF